MSAERCPRCDRTECERPRIAAKYDAIRAMPPVDREVALAADPLIGSRLVDAETRCARHEVTREQWRTRCLAAEQRAEAAEAREARLLRVNAEGLFRLHTWAPSIAVTIKCSLCLRIMGDYTEGCPKCDRAALAPAESGKETT